VRLDHFAICRLALVHGSGIYRTSACASSTRSASLLGHVGDHADRTASSATVRVETTIDNASPAARDLLLESRSFCAEPSSPGLPVGVDATRPATLVRASTSRGPSDGDGARRYVMRQRIRASNNVRQVETTFGPIDRFDRTTGSSSTNSRQLRACAFHHDAGGVARRCRKRSGSAAAGH
jgi:hypothetical protein